MDGDGHTEKGPLRRLFGEPWMIALLYVAGAVALALIGFGGLWRDLSLLPERVSPWYSLFTAIPAAATVLLRRRAPRVGLALSLPIFVVDVLTWGGLVPLLVVLEHVHAVTVVLGPRQRRTVLIWGIAGIVGFAATVLAVTGDPRLTAVVGMQIGALFGMTYWYANSVAQSRELVSLYRQRAEDLARLTQLDRITAVRDERERMAGELHDIVAGHVSAVAIRSEAALLADETGQRLDDSGERLALRAVRDSSLRAHEALRTMVSVLQSGETTKLAPLGRAQLPELVAEARRSGLDAHLDDAWVGELPESVDHAIARVVQESLANSAKHDHGARVIVRVAPESDSLGATRPGAVYVSVVSSGGRSIAQPGLRGTGIGLPGLEARVRALGGTFAAGPQPDGWTVTARIPATEERPA